MFAKLLKHDWKASSGLLLLLSGCALGFGCVAAIILRLLTTYWDVINEKEEFALVLIPAFLLLFVAYMAIILYGTATQYILLYRFYKSRFTDEGYLMFTLPVKTHEIFLSGAVNMLIWSLISIVVIAASLAIAVVVGPVWDEEIVRELRWAFTGMDGVFSDSFTPGYVIALVFSAISYTMYAIVSPMTAVVLGASAAKKHKVLAIIGFLIAFSIVTSTLTSIVSGVMQFLMFAWEDKIQLITMLTPIISSIFPLILSVVGYMLSIHLMKKRLNLP